MVIAGKKLQTYSLYLSMFFAFTGTYACMLLIDRYIALPGGTYRLLILFGLLLFYLFSGKRKLGFGEKCFLWFSFFYILRLVIEMFSVTYFYTPPIIVLINFMLGALIPFWMITKARFESWQFDIIFISIILGGVIFGIAVYSSYGSYLGQVERITRGSTGDEDVVNPLILSYISTMSIGVGITYIFGNRLSLQRLVVLIVVLMVSTIPFFLGASRGAAVALLVPFLFIVLARSNIKTIVTSVIVLACLVYAAITLSAYFGSGLFDRFAEIQSDVESGGEGNIRVTMWARAMDQFYERPFFGDGLQIVGFENAYPHNLFVEVLLNTGIIGFIPMILFVIAGFVKAMRIFRYDLKYAWVGALFIQCFVQSMFSFSIYTNKWIWITFALLFVVDLNKGKRTIVKLAADQHNHLKYGAPNIKKSST